MRSKLVHWLINAIRLFLGAVFFTGGISKLMPFPGVMGPVWLEEVLEPHGLGIYARFIAWSELVIGLLLLSIRFATLAAVMLVPLVLNILMVTISMSWQGTPYVVSFFLLLNLVLLAYDYQKWKPILLSGSSVSTSWTQPASLAKTLVCLAFCVGVIAGPIVFTASNFMAYVLTVGGLLGLFLVAAFWRENREPPHA